MYWNAVHMSLALRQLVRNGLGLNAAMRTSSQLCLIVDGIDQAKFRIPRLLRRPHALDRLPRPALHIQGAWAHGFGYHLAVADADLPKDTASNVEVIARMLDSIFQEHGALPRALHLQQDNTCRECKNQLIVKFAAKLVALKVFESVTLSYLVTGHTHENIDGTFGQVTVKLSATEFDSADDVVSILEGILKDLGIDPGARRATRCYKLDEVADWQEWWNETDLTLSRLTGPLAPHWFRICHRRDLTAGELRLAPAPGLGGPRADPGDVAAPPRSTNALLALCTSHNNFCRWLCRSRHAGGSSPPGMRRVAPGACQGDPEQVMAVKDRMASQEVLQVVTLLPAAFVASMAWRRQPRGVRPRRAGGEDVKRKVAKVAEDLRRQTHLSEQAAGYLIGWATGSLPRAKRPRVYSFLQRRGEDLRADLIVPVRGPGARTPGRLVQVQGPGRRPLPVGPESGDEAEPGPLIELEA